MRKAGLLLAAMAAPLAAQNAPTIFDAARTAPLAVGEWSYVAGVQASEARFGNAFSIRCDRGARRVTLRRIDPIAAGGPGAMTIATDLAVRTVTAGGAVANNDALLDAIAFSRGRFIVTGGRSGSRLVLPASPEAARSIEDCRN